MKKHFALVLVRNNENYEYFKCVHVLENENGEYELEDKKITDYEIVNGSPNVVEQNGIEVLINENKDYVVFIIEDEYVEKISKKFSLVIVNAYSFISEEEARMIATIEPPITTNVTNIIKFKRPYNILFIKRDINTLKIFNNDNEILI